MGRVEFMPSPSDGGTLGSYGWRRGLLYFAFRLLMETGIRRVVILRFEFAELAQSDLGCGPHVLRKLPRTG